MKITNKISLSFLITAIILTSVAGSIFYTIAGNNLEKAIIEHLKTTARLQANHIETFLEEHKQVVELMASGLIYQELFSTSKDTPKYNKILEQTNSRINKMIEVHKEIFKVSLLDKNGTVVASTYEASVGSDKSADNMYFKVEETNYTKDMHISETFGTLAINIAGPVLLNGERLGLILVTLNAKELFKITLDRTGLGETGEIYLVNKDGYMISPSRFKEDVILKQKVDTINAKNCQEHKGKKHILGRKEIDIFPDYRGVNVLGTHEDIPEMRWCLLAKIDEKEVLAPLGRIKLIFVLILIIVPIVAWLVGVYVSRIIPGPIYKLQAGTEIIGKGNLDYKVATDSMDEIGQLSRAFDKMTADLGKTTTSIDKLNKEIVERKEAEDELLKSESFHRSLLEASPDFIFSLDATGTIQTVNRVHPGHREEDVIGQRASMFVPPEYRDAFKKALRQAVDTGQLQTVETMVDLPDRRHYFLNRLTPVSFAGEEDSVVLIAVDITERKHAEEKIKEYSENLGRMVEERTGELNKALSDTENARDKIDGILKSVADGLIVTDAYNRIILMNRVAENLLGVRFSEVIDRSIDFAIKDTILLEKIKNTFGKTAIAPQFDFELPGDDPKRPRIMRARSATIFDKKGAETGIVTLIQDVTYEREMDRIKSEFIATAAHELRTPLTSIQGFSELLLTRDDFSDEDKKKFLKYINTQSVGLAGIINDLLDLSRIEAGAGLSLNRTECKAGDAIREIVQYFQETYPSFQFELSLPGKPVDLFVDKEKILQVIQNLLSNAVKFSPEGDKIRIAGEMVKGSYQVSVQDQGLGMTPEQVEKIFDRFYRADMSSTALEGTGLGMSIVKHIIEAHDGKIWVESEAGKGTTVSFTIPLSEQHRT